MLRLRAEEILIYMRGADRRKTTPDIFWCHFYSNLRAGNSGNLAEERIAFLFESSNMSSGTAELHLMRLSNDCEEENKIGKTKTLVSHRVN